MRSIVAIIISALCALTGCGRKPADQPIAPNKTPYPDPDPQLMGFLKGMYATHGAKAELAGDWILVDGGRLRTTAAHFEHRQHPQSLVLRTDFLTVLPSGEHILESFAGVGADTNAALKDACASFQACSFHVLCSALLGRHSEQADVASWDIGGIPRTVTFGSLRLRGEFLPDSWPPVFAALETQVKASGLPRGLHWVRYFYSQSAGQPPTIEVLLDNRQWSQQQKKAAELPWPTAKSFYAVRLFFIIQDK
jgi:hypothetical protein